MKTPGKLMVTHNPIIIRLSLGSWVAHVEGWSNNTKYVHWALFYRKHGQSFGQGNSCRLKWSWGLHALCVSSYTIARGLYLLQGKSKYFPSPWLMQTPGMWRYNALGKRLLLGYVSIHLHFSCEMGLSIPWQRGHCELLEKIAHKCVWTGELSWQSRIRFEAPGPCYALVSPWNFGQNISIQSFFHNKAEDINFYCFQMLCLPEFDNFKAEELHWSWWTIPCDCKKDLRASDFHRVPAKAGHRNQKPRATEICISGTVAFKWTW